MAMDSLGLYIYKLITMILPETRCFGLKRALLRICGAKIEEGVRICSSASYILGKILGSAICVNISIFKCVDWRVC